MKTNFTRPYTILIILLLAGCQPSSRQRAAPVGDTILDGHTGSTQAAMPAGKWYNDENIYGCMSLDINDSGKFIFSEESSLRRRYSEGNCYRDGNHIHLTSLDKYKNAATPATKYFQPDDTAFVYLNNEHYLLEKDTLFKLDADGFKTDAKFHRQ